MDLLVDGNGGPRVMTHHKIHDLFSTHEALHFEVPLEYRMCRGCLRLERRITRSDHASLYTELTQIQVQQSQSWQLCVECAMLLWKAIHTKRRFSQAHNILTDYAQRCAPFQIDATDKELLALEYPALTTADILVFHAEHKKNRTGFHAPLTHSEHCLNQDKYNNANGGRIKDEPESDIEDTITLEEFKDIEPLSLLQSNQDKNGVFNNCQEEIIIEELESKVEIKTESEINTEKRKKKKKKIDKSNRERRKRGDVSKHSYKKKNNVNVERLSIKQEDDYFQQSTLRKPIEVDPTKIRMITLDPQEQMRAAASSPSLQKFPFACELCHKGFNYAAKLDNHMKKHDPNRGTHECKICSMWLPTRYSYRTHMLIHTLRYECLRCGKTMTDKGCIVEHYETVHEGRVQQISCHLCGKISMNSKTHRGHMRNHHSGDRPSCDQCGKTFINKDSLSEHILIHEGVKPHGCSVCGSRFRTKTQLNHHQLTHTKEKNFYCVECDVRFKSQHNLRQHLTKSTKHRTPDSLMFSCARCPRRFESAKSLEHHVSFGHEGRRLYSCDDCGARLATRGSLLKHARAHAGYRPPASHVCDTCGRAFRSKTVLENHLRTHTGEKPYECSECGRRFSQRTAMLTHLKLVHLHLKRGAKLSDVQAAAVKHVAETKDEVGYGQWAESNTAMYTVLPNDVLNEYKNVLAS